MARPIIDTLHNKYGFHFPARHLVLQLQNLIYTQHVKRLCEETVSACPICIMGTPRKLKKIVGNVRSDIFQPGQTLIADSAFLPQDRMGFSKAIVLVDAASSHVAILPTKNLKYQSIEQVYWSYWSVHNHCQIVRTDLGSEYTGKLTHFLNKLGIQHEASVPYTKGATSQSEVTIRIAKSALRKTCLNDPKNWSNHLPLIVNAINQTQLYGKVTRNQLFYSPALFQSQLNLAGLIFPEHLFEVNKHRMEEIINIRQQNLQKAGTPPAAEIRVGNIV
jgi:hypothetical protein